MTKRYPAVACAFLALLFAAGAPLSPSSFAAPPRVTTLPPHYTDSLIAYPVAKSRKNSSALTPVVIRDLRVATYPDWTRLVLDLERRVQFTENRQNNPDRVIIELKNAKLGKAVKGKLSGGTLPEAVTITQTTPRSVAVSLKAKRISDYKILPLSNPDRLVVDIMPRSGSENITKTGDQPPPNGHEPQPRVQPVPRRTLKTIVIDPGHGGKDPGARGAHGTEEKDITLKVALLLRDLLRKEPDTRVLMTRDRDVFIELEDRAKFANSNNADLFVSIHVNSHPQKRIKGIEIYHFGEAKDQRALEVAARENGTPLSSTGVGWEYLVADLLTTKKIEDSLELAWTTKQAMVTRLNGHYNTVDHGVKTAPFYVLRFTTMPSILAEIAYISNPAEEQLLKSASFLARVAEALFDGVKAFVSPNRLSSK